MCDTYKYSWLHNFVLKLLKLLFVIFYVLSFSHCKCKGEEKAKGNNSGAWACRYLLKLHKMGLDLLQQITSKEVQTLFQKVSRKLQYKCQLYTKLEGKITIFIARVCLHTAKMYVPPKCPELDLLRAGLHSRLLQLARLLGQRNTLNKLQCNAVIVKHADHSRSKLLPRSWRCYDLECSPAPLLLGENLYTRDIFYFCHLTSCSVFLRSSDSSNT